MHLSFRALSSLLCAFALCLTVRAANPPVVFLEAEAFETNGGWVVDQQFMDQMGSPYLLAHGIGEPVVDAVTTAKFPGAGQYHVWVRTRDWVAPWKVPGAPGKFQVLIDGRPLPVTFGTEGAEWHWQAGGTAQLATSAKISLHDLTGFEGRCDAIIFAADPKFRPPNKPAELAAFRRKALGFPAEPEDGGHYDLVVVGGGIAGTCAAMAASRLGLTSVIIQDRPVLGGNNSSEVRVWLNGNINQQPYPRVGGIVAELDPKKRAGGGMANSAEIYEDQRRLELVRNEPRLTLLLEQRVIGVETNRDSIRAVVAQHIRTGKRIRITGRWFADCTGDASVGFLAGADYDMTEKQHMGPSNLWNVKQTEENQSFPDPKCLCEDTNTMNLSFAAGTAPAKFPRCPWAIDLRDKDFPGRKQAPGAKAKPALDNLGTWFWESGYDKDPITEVEWMRDQNLRAMYGAWDTLKNVDGLYPNHKLNWAAYIAGKRESRRLMGDVILQVGDFLTNRVYADGAFPCTWGIDLHTPDVRYQKGHEGEEFLAHHTGGKGYTYQGPYWAPYRCLYSTNIANLFMAGRDISVTHDALGPVRVMRTCGCMGEIVGMAASICKTNDCNPRGVYEKHLGELKALMEKGVGKGVEGNSDSDKPSGS